MIKPLKILLLTPFLVTCSPKHPSTTEIEQKASFSELLKALQDPKDCDSMKAAANELVVRIEDASIDTLMLGNHNHVYTPGEETFTYSSVKERGRFPIIAHQDSSLVQSLIVSLNPGLQERFEGGDNWVIFPPKIANCTFVDNSIETGGVALIDGPVMVRTKDSKGKTRTEGKAAEVLAHEFEHKRNEGKGFSMLENERRSLEISVKVLEEKVAAGETVLSSDLSYAKGRLATANYLSNVCFEGKFDRIYPLPAIRTNQILAKGLKQSELEVVCYPTESPSFASEVELKSAVRIALLVLTTEGKEEQIRRLYDLIRTSATSPLDRTNATSALKYLNAPAFTETKERETHHRVRIPPLTTLLTENFPPIVTPTHTPIQRSTEPQPQYDGNRIYLLAEEHSHTH